MRPRVLLHVCCGPCSVYPVRVLLEQGYEVMGLFYNPNIQPLQEYLLRREAAEMAAGELGIRIIFQDRDAEPRFFLRQVVFREDNRCFLCQQMRLERTRSVALRGGFAFFATTLMFSRIQPFEQIQMLGKSLETGKCTFLDQDFRTGWHQGNEQSRAMGLYRQNYCGCIYSEFERFRGKLGPSDEQ
ncbi:epoxyqueuosine reductase QueH [Desulfonatronospira sp.]|uniref:epoxyqueuosine reductase QueH n=1 Tax=Desulfonatronospira sp. TaxID=1962951 RepID=UPI0025C5AEC4|nr:epoxyqueuosine reductase QueH [Desulfonatronospira sp.]